MKLYQDVKMPSTTTTKREQKRRFFDPFDLLFVVPRDFSFLFFFLNVGFLFSKFNTQLLRDVFRKGDLYFRTGDLVREDESGYFYFVDRIGDTFRKSLPSNPTNKNKNKN